MVLDKLNIFCSQSSCDRWFYCNCTWLKVRMSRTDARCATVIECLLQCSLSSTTCRDFSLLLMTDHELEIEFFRIEQLRPTAAAPDPFCTFFQDEWVVVVVPESIVYGRVVCCFLALHLYSNRAAAAAAAAATYSIWRQHCRE